MKKIDVIAAFLLMVGGANWGLVGFFNFDLVAMLLGDMTVASRLVYVLVGLSAAFQALQWKTIRQRWCGKAPAMAG